MGDAAVRSGEEMLDGQRQGVDIPQEPDLKTLVLIFLCVSKQGPCLTEKARTMEVTRDW